MKRNLIFIYALFIASLFTFSSCKDSLNEVAADKTAKADHADFTVQNGRLVFKNRQSLEKTLNELRNKGNQFWNSWESKIGFTSYRRSGLLNEGNEIIKGFGFPAYHATLLDKNQTYQIGDTIVFFDNGYQYFIPKKDEQLLQKLKKQENVDVLKYKMEAKVTEKSDKNARVAMGTNSVDARYQYRFWTDGGSERKIIFEIATVTYYCGSGCAPTIELLTRIKQEWKNSKGQWLPAGETMQKRISNLSYSFTYTSPFGYSFTKTGSGINVPTQEDGSNLEYSIDYATVGSYTVYADVSGDYWAWVTAPYNSNGFYNIIATW